MLTINPTNTTKVSVNVTNVQHIQNIGGRDVTFGVKETVEEAKNWYLTEYPPLVYKFMRRFFKEAEEFSRTNQ